MAVALLLLAGSAHANEADDVVDKLIRFAIEGCDFLHANIPPGSQPLPPDSTLAPHFGKIVRVTHKLERETLSIEVARFRGWPVTLRRRWIEIRPPARVRMTLGDFERRLGHAEPPDVDMYSSAGEVTGAADAEPEELVFAATKTRPGCWIRVTTDTHPDERSDRRVLAFRFTD